MIKATVRRELKRVVKDEDLDLGELETYYSSDFASPIDTLGGGIGFGIFAAGAAAGIFLLKVDDDGQVAKNIVMAAILLFMLPLSLYCLFMSFRTWGNRFKYNRHWLIYADGLAVLESGEATAYRWADLTVRFEQCVFLPIPSSRKKYKLTGRKKKPIPLPGFNKAKCMKIMLAVQKKQEEMLVPGLAKSVKGGETAKFGTVEIKAGGIEVNGDAATWEDVKKFEFAYDKATKDIHMSVECRGRSALTGRLREIPNVWMMFSLVSALKPKLAAKTPGAEAYLT